MGFAKLRQPTATKLARIAEMSRENSLVEFKWLMSHFNEESLKECFHELDAKKARGVDGIGKEEYSRNLDDNIAQLIAKMKTMSYRPGPVREVRIPKEGTPVATRPLGISNFEDKIVQLMTAKILTAIYEPTFRECSFGFRPGRSCHTAIKSLMDYLHDNPHAAIIDVDLRNFFGTLSHEILLDFLRLRIKDEVFLRYIVRMLRSGVLSDGELRMTDEGSPQGNVASPILANIYAHYVLDCWFQDVVKQHCRGKVEMFRYADDLVVCCQFPSDAERIHRALVGRLGKHALSLNTEKTKIVPFDANAARRGVSQGTFDFLGFTFYLGKSRRGFIVTKVKTSRKRFRIKLKRVKEWVILNRHNAITMLWPAFCRKLEGHVRYFGVSLNSQFVKEFLLRAIVIFWKWMNRRSQKRSITWAQFNLFMSKYPPPRARICFPLFTVTSK
jgi:group II intron reverse transcriptase/maturase